MRLYREQVLGEKPITDMVPISMIAPAPKPVKAVAKEEVGSFGD
jgi:hypothetical protein